MENYYSTLPVGYREAFVVDAKEKKTSIVFTAGSLLISLLCFLPIFFNCDFSFLRSRASGLLIGYLIFLVGIFGYIVLHELVHGAAYKFMTHQKLTFGLTLTVAFCGVPDIYTSRRTALISLSAPFVTFSVILIPLTVFLYGVNQMYFAISGFILALHLGGCIGDLFGMYLFLFRFRDPRTLMNDTGPKQTFYVPEP